MRKRYFLLAAGAVAGGLAILGSVGAQTPPGGAAKVPVPTYRPYGEWSNPPGYVPPSEGVKPAGGYLPAPNQPQDNRPRLTSPVMAGADGVRPINAMLPPPNMEMMQPGAAPSNGGTVLPPPNLGAPPAIPAAGPAVSPAIPPTGPATVPPLPSGVTPVPPAPDTPPIQQVLPAIPAVPAAPTGGIPAASSVPPPASGVPSAPSVLPPLGTQGNTAPSAPAMSPVRSMPSAVSGTATRLAQNVSIEAVCPESVVFGQEFRYELIVRNSGTSSVAGIRIDDDLPAGTKYLGSDPPAEMSGDHLSWMVGSLDAGADKRIVIRVKPIEEGEIKSRATVTFVASVDAKAKVTRPRVAVAVIGSEVCKAGDETVFQLRVSNSGTGPAGRMIVQALLTDGLVHPQGAKLEMEMANLAAGETRTVPLRVSAGKAGLQTCQVTVAVEGCPDTSSKASVNIVEPLLQIAQSGPTKCHVRAEPTYEVTLTNPGTATTDPVSLYAVLPEGFEYVQGSDNAAFSATNRAVVWKLSGLAPAATKTVTLKLRSTAAGDGLLRTIAQTTPEQPIVGAGGIGMAAKPTGRVLEAKTETSIKAEGVAAVRFEVIDLDDPVEVGKEAVYEIRVMNQGTGACTNVQLVAAVAEGTEYKGSSGPTQVKSQGQHLIFEPIASLAAKGEAVYRVKIRGTAAGDLRFRVQLTCDQVRTPVVKEESTRFYKE